MRSFQRGFQNVWCCLDVVVDLSNFICIIFPSFFFHRYEYRTAEAFVKDFELMKSNAVKFNGAQHQFAAEATEIYRFVKEQVEASSSEFGPLEEEVAQLMSSKGNKKQKLMNKKKFKGTIKVKKSTTATTPTPSCGTSSSTTSNIIGGINIGDLSQFDEGNGTDTDSDAAAPRVSDVRGRRHRRTNRVRAQPAPTTRPVRSPW